MMTPGERLGPLGVTLGTRIARMPSATRIVDRLPSLYRPEVDAVGPSQHSSGPCGSGLDG